MCSKFKFTKSWKHMNVSNLAKLSLSNFITCDKTTGITCLYHLLVHKNWECIEYLVSLKLLHYCDKCSIRYNILTLPIIYIADKYVPIYINMIDELLAIIPSDTTNKYICNAFLQSIIHNNIEVYERILSHLQQIPSNNIISHINYFDTILSNNRFHMIELYCFYNNENPFQSISLKEEWMETFCTILESKYSNIFESHAIKYILLMENVSLIKIILNKLTSNKDIFIWAIEENASKLVSILLPNITFENIDISYLSSIGNEEIRSLIQTKLNKMELNISSLYSMIINSI